MIEYTLHLDKLRDIAVRGVRRASIFMGIAANVSKLEPPVSHILDDKFKIVLVPDNVSEATKRHFIDEFEKSVVANGLRELIDTFGLFLSEVYAATNVAHQSRGKTLTEHPKPSRAFDRENVADQLTRLHGIFGVEFELAPMFASLVTARNCLTHNRGIVRSIDCEAGHETFGLTWRNLTMWLETKDGKVVAEFEPGTDKGFDTVLEGETTVKAQFRDFVKVFKVGAPIEISRHELAQICQGVIGAADLVIKALLDHLTALGIPQAPPKEGAAGDPTDV